MAKNGKLYLALLAAFAADAPEVTDEAAADAMVDIAQAFADTLAEAIVDAQARRDAVVMVR